MSTRIKQQRYLTERLNKTRVPGSALAVRYPTTGTASAPVPPMGWQRTGRPYAVIARGWGHKLSGSLLIWRSTKSLQVQDLTTLLKQPRLLSLVIADSDTTAGIGKSTVYSVSELKSLQPFLPTGDRSLSDALIQATIWSLSYHVTHVTSSVGKLAS